MLKLVIGNKNYSSWSMRPWLAMRANDIAFEEVFIPLYTDDKADKDRILSFSRAGKVPALIDGDVTVWDSLSIIEYLAEKFPQSRLWPEHRARRAHARSVSAEMHSGFAALRTQLPLNCRRERNGYRWDADAQRDIDRVQAIWRDLRARFGGDGDFLCGEFGIVDAMFAPVCTRFVAYGVEMDAAARDYAAAIYALPAMREWLAAAQAEPEHLPATDRG